MEETNPINNGRKLEDLIGRKIWLIFNTGKEFKQFERFQGTLIGVDNYQIILFEDYLKAEKGFNRADIKTWEEVK